MQIVAGNNNHGVLIFLLEPESIKVFSIFLFFFGAGPLSHKYPSYPATTSAYGMDSYSPAGLYQPSNQPYNPVQTFDPSQYR